MSDNIKAIRELLDSHVKLRKALVQQRAYVLAWEDDHRAGLLPTEQSLNDAREAIEKVLK